MGMSDALGGQDTQNQIRKSCGGRVKEGLLANHPVPILPACLAYLSVCNSLHGHSI